METRSSNLSLSRTQRAHFELMITGGSHESYL